MKVYVVNFGWNYEGEATSGVFSSVEKARDAIATGDVTFVDNVAIYEIELDAPLNIDKVECQK